MFLVSKGITGFTITETFEIPVNFWLGFLFFVVGVVLLWGAGVEQRTIRELEHTLQTGKVGDSKELRRYARRLGFDIKEGGNM